MSIQNYIHDTLTSGLQLELAEDTAAALEAGLLSPSNAKTIRKFKNGKTYTAEVYLKEALSNSVTGNESKTWLISLKRTDDVVFTKIGLKLRKEIKNKSVKRYLNITANPTAILRCDYALNAVKHMPPLKILTAPFKAIEAITGQVFCEREWDRIKNGDIALFNLEIAFPLQWKLSKKEILLGFEGVFGAKVRTLEGVVHLGQTLNYSFSRFPEISEPGVIDGIKITINDYRESPLFSFTLYDKLKELDAKNKCADITDRKHWKEHLRVDIRLFPAFMKQLAQEAGIRHSDPFTIGDWVKIEDRKDFSEYLLKKCLQTLNFNHLLRPLNELKIVLMEMENTFGEKFTQEWKSAIRVKNSPLCKKHGVCGKKFERFRTKHGLPTNIGGLPFFIPHVFNFTAGLNLQDIAVDDVSELAKTINKKKQSENFDKWENLKANLRGAL